MTGFGQEQDRERSLVGGLRRAPCEDPSTSRCSTELLADVSERARRERHGDAPLAGGRPAKLAEMLRTCNLNEPELKEPWVAVYPIALMGVAAGLRDGRARRRELRGLFVAASA